jgi:hypothetical protein
LHCVLREMSPNCETQHPVVLRIIGYYCHCQPFAEYRLSPGVILSTNSHCQ